MIRVAFPYPRHAGRWLGGANYLRNLAGALASSPRAGIQPILLAERGTVIPPIAGVGLLESRVLGVHRWLAERGTWHRLEADPVLDCLLRTKAIDVLSHSNPLGRWSRTPVVGWIPDFQHRHLPHFFNERDSAVRDEMFEKMCRLCARVIVSSEAALADLTRFLPRWASKARVVRFVAGLARCSEEIDRTVLERRYGFEGPYLFLPNQFWVHKNHRVVLEAVGLLAAAGRRVLVLATGQAGDYRAPGFFEWLMRRRAELGVEREFRVLGTVSYEDLTALMRHAVAIVNPSLFEGWSTTVEEAKSLGKRVVLSDIPVHREQAPARGTYFDPGSAEQLAGLLWESWSHIDHAEEARASELAATELSARQRAFAGVYADVVHELVDR